MERKLIFLILFTISGITYTSAQDRTALPKSFSESYTFESKGEYLKAIESIRKVYSADSYEMNIRLGWLYFEAKNYKESLVYYNRAIQLLPLSIEAKLGYAYPAYALGQKDAVIAKYKEILAKDPNNFYGNYRLGALYFENKDYTNARKHFEKLLNFYPFDYDILIMSAWTNYYLNKPREARVLFNKALLNRPGDKSATEGLSLIK